jgi:hypothetical protein
MTAELRDYVIAAGHLEDFVAAWLQGVAKAEQLGVPVLDEEGFRRVLAGGAP